MVIESTKNTNLILFIIFGVLIINFVNAQELKKHQWKNRVVLIVAQNEDSKEYQQQIAEFNALHKELRERKLLTYLILPLRYTIINYPVNPEKNEWISSSTLFDKFAGENIDFKVLLIGLDGGIKLQKNGLLTAEELFGTIDPMPMRRAELNKKKE